MAISSSLKTLWGSAVGWSIFRSPSVRVGRGDTGKTVSGGTDRVLLRRPFVLYKLMMVKPVVDGLKKPFGVKRSSAITSPLPKKRGWRETESRKDL